jgi:N-methylhydantoinase B
VETPVRIERYELVPDSGGAGTYRGALGQIREVHCLADEAVLQIRSDKRRFLPYGLQGGSPGTPSWNVLTPGDAQTILPTLTMTSVHRDDLLRHTMAGGGGWGNPFERDPELVRADVWNEKVTLEHARAAYGVAIDPETLQIDWAATLLLRELPRANPDEERELAEERLAAQTPWTT